VLVLIFWAAAAVLGLVVLGIVGFGLSGQLTRLMKAVEEAQAQLAPTLTALRSPSGPGKHRAD
jgi:hypothetical protein